MVLAVLLAGMLMGGMDFTILNVALPTIGRVLLPTNSELLWTVDAYSLTVAATLVVCATAGDRLGRKRVLLAGAATFGVASAAAALSSAPGQLIAARAVQGLGYAMLLSSTVAVIRVVFPVARERALAYGLWVAASSTGAALGPVLGGLLVESFSWGAVFLVNLPIVVVILALGAALVPESRGDAVHRFDAFSAVLSILGLAGTVYGLQHIGQPGPVPLDAVLVGIAGVALLVVFVVRQRRIDNPLLDLRLFGDRRFSTATVSILVCYGCYTGLLFLLTQQLQSVHGYSPAQSGLALVPVAVSSAVGGVVAPRLAAVVGNRWGVTTGVVVLALAVTALAVFGAAGNFAAFAGVGLGAGIVMALGADSMMTAAPPERAGEAGAVQETGFSLGAGLGVAALGVLTAVSYRWGVGGATAALTPEWREAVNGSISGALRVADDLGGAAGEALRAAARSAYEASFSFTGAVVASALLLLAVSTAVLLRPAAAVEADRPAEEAESSGSPA
ncbi:DHA2 family multidrug resistance protein-like MFS transporter [Saccharothrix australiensis]|uniref:DHA2 family multidrug resistance protein-like MFS transporter n=1 Tax=Saccharothrix australiensis TaxID=2072 RepID=A0A495VYZ8_9PSEU|nr:DHA2 family multidrug resistance protein-like MFS transporter [Saccharothrix australiensis]